MHGFLKFLRSVLTTILHFPLVMWSFVQRVWQKENISPSSGGSSLQRPSQRPDRNKTTGIEDWLKEQISYYDSLIEQEEREHWKYTPKVREGLFIFILLLVIFGFVPGYIFAVHTYVPSIYGISLIVINPQYFLYLPLIVYLLAGFRTVGLDEVAGADFFGTPVHQFKPGLKWVPLFILRFSKEYATFVQSEFPGDTDHIQWSEEKEPLEQGKVRPIYVLSGENPDGKLPTDKQMNVGMSALAKFQLIRERFFDFVMNVGPIDEDKRENILTTITGGANVENSDRMLEVVRHLRDTATAVLGEIAGQLSYNEMTAYRHLISVLVWRRLQETVLTWGLKIVEARITTINPGHTFNEQIQLRATAIARRDDLISLAEGEKQQLILKGEGEAAAELALLTARAEGYKKIAKSASLKGGEIAISAETAGKLAAAGNTVVVGTDGVKDLIGLVAAGKKV